MEIKEKQELYLKNLLSYKKECDLKELKEFEVKIYNWLRVLKLDYDSNLITIIHNASNNMVEIEILIPNINYDLDLFGTGFTLKKEIKVVNALSGTCIGTEEYVSDKCKEFEHYILNNKLNPITPIINYKKKLENNIIRMDMYIGLNPNKI